MCGIVAVYGKKQVVHDIYESLTVLQHRGFKENVEIVGELSVVDNPVNNKSPA